MISVCVHICRIEKVLCGITSIVHWTNLNMFHVCLNLSSYYSLISLLNLLFSLIHESCSSIFFFIFAHTTEPISFFFPNSVEICLTSLWH